MTSVQEILRETEKIPNESLREMCAHLVNSLSAHQADHTTMWTFKSLSNLVGVMPSDLLLHESIQVLVSRPRTKLLDIHFLYFDSTDENSSGTKIDDEEVAAAYETGYLIHPEIGSELADFESRLVPYFQISECLEAYGIDN